MSRVKSTPPNRRRQSRKESQIETRRRLLTAAAEVFVDRGFYGASVEEIAERAGYSKGAVYSNFASKDDLFLALYDERHAAQVEEVSEVIRDSASSTEVLRSLRDRANRSEPELSWLVLTTEFWLYAMRNPDIRTKFAKRMRVLRGAYKRAIEHQFALVGVSPPVAVGDLALILQVLDDGLLAQHLLDPRNVRKGIYFDAMGALFDALVALATTSTDPHS